jgi:hypothetical protein
MYLRTRTGFGHESKNSKKSKCHLAPKIVNIKIGEKICALSKH